MQVSSISNNLYIQNKKQKVQQGNGEYLHKAIKYSGADKIIEFTDKDSGRKVQFYSDDAIEKSFQRKFGLDYKNDGKIVKATGDFENYLQKMWSFNVNDTNTKDVDGDGYLGIKEVADSKRIVDIKSYNDTTKELKLDVSSTRETSSSEEEALEKVKRYFKDNGVTNNKITVDEDFNRQFYVDTNLDGNIEDIEILADMPPQKLMEYKDLSISEKKELYVLTKNWKKKKDEEEGKLNFSENNSVALQSNFDYLDRLLSSNKIDNQDFNKLKNNLNVLDKYVNTQADNAKIFSLKV